MDADIQDDRLRAASEHLQYEYWMLVSLANGLATQIALTGWLQNALIESFVIHYRALYDFLYSEPRGDDVAAAHYFESADAWARIRPPASTLLIDSRTRAGKEIAHLTYARLDVTPPTKGWQFVKIAKELQNVMKVFLDNVPKSLLAEKWSQTIPDPLPLLSVWPEPSR